MPSANNTSNSSNILSNNFNVVVTSELGSRLITQVAVSSLNGFTGGDVIRYDVASSGYTLSCANSASNSEVFGVVETKEEPNKLNVVLYGSINYPEERLINLEDENFGGNDIYFLSSAFPGRLVNLPTTTIGTIVKPIYQVGPHITFTSNLNTGVIVNYIGYMIMS